MGRTPPLYSRELVVNLICQVPARFRLLYGPRDEKELEVMKDVTKAAVWWMSGVDSKSIEDSWS